MARVRCWVEDCRFWKDGICSSSEIEVYPDEGCVTMEMEEFAADEEEWEEDEWEDEEENEE